MMRRYKAAKLALMILSGAFLTQLGSCTVMALQTGVTSLSPSLIDANGRFLGIFNVCGVPNVQVIGENGAPTGGILNGGDDLFYGCPVTTIGP
ncbi:MAG: hypothetical protein HBSAPP02_14150 [Phycisphaerae bacterium]|nr:MAG: hypothetical protein HRU71_07720 [Planctomycetia bacterium]GJQ26383.1 MAG: hypothetical protein HBSAPP02_14150 [Phycisphaerae bacterium]